MAEASPVLGLDRLSESKTPIAMFYAYQRTTFTDSFRLALCLKRQGKYLPVFLLGAGTGSGEMLRGERQQCLDAGIPCFSEEEVLGFDAARVKSRFEEVKSEVRELVNVDAGTNERTLSRRVAAVASRLFAKCIVLARKLRYGASLSADRTVLPHEGGTVTITWSTMGRRVETCEVILTDYARDEYTAWIAKSGSSPILIHHDTTFALKCYDREGKVVPGPPPVLIRVKRITPDPNYHWTEPSPGARRKGLAGRNDLRAMPWFGWFQTFQKAKLNYLRVLQVIRPAVICLAEDIPGSLSPPLIRAARMRRIPTFIVPFTIPNIREVLEYYTGDRSLIVRSPRHDELVAAYPHWVADHRGTRVFRYVPELIVASEVCGIAPPRPFILNSGRADKILVESERMLSVYGEYDFPPAQLALTGSAADDFLHAAFTEKEERRRALYERLNLPLGRPMLLSALVPDQFLRGIPFCEFENYTDLVDFWVKSLAAYAGKFNVILKIGPRDRREDFLHLEEHGIAVAPDDTADLVPLADVYVASISSTLRWAIACGIPSINYDVYHFRYGDFASERGIVHVEKKREFIDALDRVLNDDVYRSNLARMQRTSSFRWGRLDGRAVERITATFDRVRDEIALLPAAALKPQRSRGLRKSSQLQVYSVLIAVQHATQMNELMRAAKVLRASGRYRIVFWIDTEDPIFIDELGDSCRMNGFEMILRPKRSGSFTDWRMATVRRNLRARFFGYCIERMSNDSILAAICRRAIGWREPIMDPYAEENHFRLAWKNESMRAEDVSAVLSESRPDLVVGAEDGIGANASLIAVAHEREIPSLVVPYEFSQRKQIFTMGARLPVRKDSPFDSLIAQRYPKWVIVNDHGVEALRMPSVIALAKELQELSIANPWTVHGGRADKLAVESPRMHQHYLAEGLPAEKLHYTGALANDDMFDAMRSDPLAATSFKKGIRRTKARATVLCAIPPDYTGHSRVKCEFKNFRDLVNFWIDCVAGLKNVDAVFQIHPGMGKEAAEYIRSSVPVATENIASLIPRCDFLVTSASSIIRFAISCRKPVINYDVYNFDHPDYVDAPGVVNVRSQDMFRCKIRELAQEDMAYDTQVADLVRRSEQWGVIDGRAGARLLELADSLVRRQN